MALLMVMAVCFLVYAMPPWKTASATRSNPSCHVPGSKGQTGRHRPHGGVSTIPGGLHLRSVAGQWPLVFNLTEEHGNLLQLLGQPYMQLYGVRYA